MDGSGAAGASALPTGSGPDVADGASGIATAVPSSVPSSPTADPAVSCVSSGAALDPKRIVGYVMSRHASSEGPPRFEGEIVTVGIEPTANDIVQWQVTVKERAGEVRSIGIYAPKTLACPLVPGQRVKASVHGSGGGPNRRYNLVFQAVDGSLLLAVNEAPSDWQVERGKPGGTDPGGAYTTRSYGVRVTHAGQRVDVSSGKWARIDVDGCAYYLWGSAAERTLHPGKRPMPDYVGGWLDFAIVRAR
jgi:hypothetical protein